MRRRSVRLWRSVLAFVFLSLAVPMLPAVQHPVPNFVATDQDRLVPDGTRLTNLWTGADFSEGPVPMATGNILFSDIGDRILRFNPRSPTLSIFREPSGKANGLIYDARGRLIACEGAGPGGNRRVSITDALGKVTTLADRYEGKRFNSPNDLTVATNGNVYFTDPRYVGEEPRELDFEGVFLIEPNGNVRLATRDVAQPNGIEITPSGRVMYVSDNSRKPEGPHQLVAFRVQPDGTLTDKRVLFDFGANHRGIDGMTLDSEGNIYAAAGSGDEAGIYIFSPRGKPLAWIEMPGDPTNCVFGIGPEANVLYITAQGPVGAERAGKRVYGLYYAKLTIPGYHLFPKAKK